MRSAGRYIADDLHPGDYEELVRKANNAFAGHNPKPRKKQPRIKENIVQQRGYKNQRLLVEDTAEFKHRPAKASHLNHRRPTSDPLFPMHTPPVDRRALSRGTARPPYQVTRRG